MVAAVLMVAMSAQAFATSKTVSVTEAGTLSTLIPASEKNAITSLTVSGTLNGTDIRFIREMAGLDIEGETTDGKLTELNIAGIELTDGGDAYYEDAWSKYYTATSYDVSEDNDLYYCTDLSYAFTGTNLTKVVWPATMWEVGENALAYCSDLKEFVLGSETNEIKPHAFSRCSALETITLTPKIIYIDEFAFSDCSSLKSIALPAGLEMLDKSCFLGCSSLASVTFGDVTEIREKVFYGCKALTNVVLPATLTKLDKAAFDGCSSLTEITLPKKLKTLGEAVFEGCTALKAINVAEGNASFASADGVLFNKAKTNLLAFPAGKTGAYAVPSGTEEIAASAFSRCVGLSAITLPETLTSNGDEAAQMATEHLISTGSRRIAFVGGPNHLDMVKRRKHGYLEALREHRIPIDREIVMCDKIDYHTALDNTLKLLRQPNRPDAILAFNDIITFAAYTAIRQLKLKIPQDVALIGFTDDVHTEYVTPRMSVIADQSQKMGAEACRLLLKAIGGDNKVRNVIVPQKLVIRETSAKS